ncbi:sensor histidine kinase [Fusibacter ferrireducens]|uniref:histidine kinase n=1 Tax=Fusibacter ferrireducens TaxID=2785058 RepID=A0ABR9ZS10_9FIRM|nr:histidine kinase [Fusibacter ferrireducens]MBF4693126.1 hypothetical protein [Fusibacter ferrireducens]
MAKNKKIIGIRLFAGVLLSLVALYFEKASGMRLAYLMLLLVGFLGSAVIGIKTKSRNLYFIECGLVLGLNYISRFNLNMIFIAFYLILIVESFFVLSREDALKVGFLSMGLLGINFYLIVPYGINYELIAEMCFLEMILILVMTALYFSKSYWIERNKVVSLLDENEQKRISLEKALDTVSTQNKSLERTQTEVIRLTRIAERAELASALHDTLGHEITGLIMQIEMLNMQYQDPLAKEAADHAREILRAMRETVETLQVSPMDDSTMVKLKQKVAAFTAQTQIKTHFEFEVNIDTLDAEYREMIFRTVLEALTNTARHSDATEIWLMLNVLTSGELLLKIIDNGKSKNMGKKSTSKHERMENAHNDFEEGNGLRFIRERVSKLGGTSEIISDAHLGFQIMIKFRGGRHD